MHAGTMDPVRFGQFLRAVRLRLRLRQVDLARRAGVSQSKISRIERGLVADIRVGELQRICAAPGVRLELYGTWRGRTEASLLDTEHAAIVELLVRDLRPDGWEMLVEYGFNHYGDRGTVDIVGWHPASRSLLIVEVKTLIVDVQDLIATLNRKARVVPRIVAAERGWSVATVSRLLAVRGSHPARDAIARHAATFASELPSGTQAARTWLRQPSGTLRGVMFVTESRLVTITKRPCRSQRVKTRRS